MTESASPDVELSPTISVIVRSMDRPSLAAALQSVAQQQMPGVEVVVVVACGAAHSALPDRAGPHRVRRIDTGHALPRAEAANAGLDAAGAQRVIFLDDDDVFLPGHLARLHEALQSTPDAIAAYADVEYGREGPQGWQAEHVFGGEFDALRLRFENFMPLHAVIVDRSRAAARDCRFDETLELFEDWDWWLQLSRQGRFVHVGGVSARYVAAPGGGSGVFAEDAAAARRRLLLKWLARDGDAERLALLQALQHHYRAAHQAQDQLELGRRTERDLRAMVAARDDEVAILRDVLAAREREVGDAARQLDDLRAVITTREREIGDAARQLDDLRAVIAAREHEIAARDADARTLRERIRGFERERPIEAFRRAWRRSDR